MTTIEYGGEKAWTVFCFFYVTREPNKKSDLDPTQKKFKGKKQPF